MTDKRACKDCGGTTHKTLSWAPVILDDDGYCIDCRPHGVFSAVTVINPSVGQMRYRAFCRCGWAGRATDTEDDMMRQYVAHVPFQAPSEREAAAHNT